MFGLFRRKPENDTLAAFRASEGEDFVTSRGTKFDHEDLLAMTLAMVVTYENIVERGGPQDAVDALVVAAAAQAWLMAVERDWKRSNRDPGASFTVGVHIGYTLAGAAAAALVQEREAAQKAVA